MTRPMSLIHQAIGLLEMARDMDDKNQTRIDQEVKRLRAILDKDKPEDEFNGCHVKD